MLGVWPRSGEVNGEGRAGSELRSWIGAEAGPIVKLGVGLGLGGPGFGPGLEPGQGWR